MSISPIQKGNTPLMHFSFLTDSGAVVANLPSATNKYVVYIHDSTGVRTGGGTISNVNTAAGTCDYQSVAADFANTGVVTMWSTADLGEPVPRGFDPQKILVEDPTQS